MMASEADEQWDEFVEALAAGDIAVMDAMKHGREQMCAEGDCEGFVNFTRASHVLMQDKRILVRLFEEISAEISKAGTGKQDVDALSRKVASKDGHRLFDKLGNIQSELYGGSPSLLPQASFEDCLSRYKRLIKHVEGLWDDACRHFKEERYPLAVFLSILAIEEIGKLGRIWHDLLAWDQPPANEVKDLGALGRDHRKKHFMGVVSGAVVNARLDRIFGEKRIKSLLQDVDSGKIERFRQSCLYIDINGGQVVLPEDLINADDAVFYTVLAGELWADVLGHFPWDYELMFDKVVSFELEIGMDPETVKKN